MQPVWGVSALFSGGFDVLPTSMLMTRVTTAETAFVCIFDVILSTGGFQIMESCSYAFKHFLTKSMRYVKDMLPATNNCTLSTSLNLGGKRFTNWLRKMNVLMVTQDVGIFVALTYNGEHVVYKRLMCF